MKKIMLAMMVCFAITAVCQAAGIEITMPQGGRSYPLQMSLSINWNNTGYPDSSLIKLVLFKGGTDSSHKVGNIVQNIPIGTGGHGSYPWNVGKIESGAADIGDEYRIRIISMNGTFDCFSKSFSIISNMATDEPTGSNMLPQKGECVISEFSVKPVEGTNPHLLLLIKCKNQSSRTLRNLRLTLVKNHLSIKEWSSINIGSGAAVGIHYQDAMPLPGKTNHYIAILSWGDPIAQPQSVLDRKETEYRRGTTIIGHL